MNSLDLKEVFEKFREQCIWTRTCLNTYWALFESGPEPYQLMERNAPTFFRELKLILIEYLLLQVSKHLDPKQSNGRTNLTVAYLDSELGRAKRMTPEIERLSHELAQYRPLIKDARNRLLSHTDRDTVLSNHRFPAHTEEEVTKFFENLQQYCDAVGEAVGSGPLDFRATPATGDVHDLLQCLRRA